METDHLEELGVDWITVLKWTRVIEWENMDSVYLARDGNYWLVLVSVVIEGLGSIKCGIFLAHLRNDYCQEMNSELVKNCYRLSLGIACCFSCNFQL
jgi:hypothetical protein